MATTVFEYLPIALMVYGAVAVLWSSRYMAAARCYRDPQRALTMMRGLRLMILDLAVFGVGAGLWWDSPVVIGLAVIVAAEELLETSIVITALRRQLRSQETRITTEARRHGDPLVDLRASASPW